MSDYLLIFFCPSHIYCTHKYYRVRNPDEAPFLFNFFAYYSLYYSSKTFIEYMLTYDTIEIIANICADSFYEQLRVKCSVVEVVRCADTLQIQFAPTTFD